MIKHYRKIADVCQLMNKNNYPATQTKSGITFTNNGDGTITCNGTATGNAYYTLQTLSSVINHKYLLKGCPSGGGSSIYRIQWDSKSFFDDGNGSIKTLTNDTQSNVLIKIGTGTTVSNLIFTPQLFDLTEMYGAGNEPTTVAEFKTKFPNDYYPYSPKTWVSYYKRNSITNRFGSVDLGSLNWSSLGYTAGGYLTTGAVGAKIATDKLCCSRYTTLAAGVITTSTPDMSIRMYNGNQNVLYIKDTRFTDATAFKNSLSGVYLHYELATVSDTPKGFIPTYKTAIRLDTKNLFDKDSAINGYWKNDGTFVVINDIKTIYAKVSPNTTYIISNVGEWDYLRLCYFNSYNPTTFTRRQVQSGSSSYIFTTDNDTTMVCFSPSTNGFNNSSNVQLEQGSTATSYVPYGKID